MHTYFTGPALTCGGQKTYRLAGSCGEERRVPAVQGESQGEQQGQALRREARGMQQPPRGFVLPVVRVGCHGAAPLRPPRPAALRSLLRLL